MFTARGCDFCSLDDVRSPRRGEHDVLTYCSGTGGGRTEMCPPFSHVSPDRQEDGKSDFFFLERTSHLPRAVESCTVHDTHDVSLLVLSCARTGSVFHCSRAVSNRFGRRGGAACWHSDHVLAQARRDRPVAVQECRRAGEGWLLRCLQSSFTVLFFGCARFCFPLG